MNDADVELVDEWGEGQVDFFLELSDVLLTSEFSDYWESGVLDVENGFVDFLDIVFRNLHP